MSRKRSIRGKRNPGLILRQPCRCYLTGTCTRSPCEYWHPPECQFYETESGCTAWDKFLFPHHKVDEQQNKKLPKGHCSHKRRKSKDKNAVAIVITVSQLGCVSQDSEALVSQSGKQSRGNPMQKVSGPKNTSHSVYATSSEYPGKKKEHRLGKMNVKVLHQRSPYAMKLEDRSQEETERQQRCSQSKAWNLAKNIFKLKKERQSYFLLARGRMGPPSCVNNKAGGKRVCGRFRSYAYGQQESP